jgi:hypothetical protein
MNASSRQKLTAVRKLSCRTTGRKRSHSRSRKTTTLGDQRRGRDGQSQRGRERPHAARGPPTTHGAGSFTPHLLPATAWATVGGGTTRRPYARTRWTTSTATGTSPPGHSHSCEVLIARLPHKPEHGSGMKLSATLIPSFVPVSRVRSNQPRRRDAHTRVRENASIRLAALRASRKRAIAPSTERNRPPRATVGSALNLGSERLGNGDWCVRPTSTGIPAA